MDFYMTCSPCPKCIIQRDRSSAHFNVLRLLQFFVAIFMEEEAGVSAKDKTLNESTLPRPGPAGGNQRAHKEVIAFLESVRTAGAMLQQQMGSQDWARDSVRNFLFLH